MNSRPHFDPDWQTTYAEMIASPKEAIKRLRPGQRVFIGTGCSRPLQLIDALTARASELPDTEIMHLLTYGAAPYARKELAQYFRVNSLFIAENVREIIQEGLGDYTPIFLSDIPRLFHSGQLPIDAALIQVSPPDVNGMCSLGVSVDIVKSAAENAALVIAEVNPHMPRTLGNTLLHVYDFDALVPVDDPLIEIPPEDAGEEIKRIAEYVAAFVEDGSTLELGIGGIPHEVLAFLKDKKNLGIHTEMLTDDVIDLIESGVINGSRKTIDRGKVVASFCLGTRRLYDYIDNNPAFAFHPTEYVNDPFVISRHHKMVAINTALEVDLTGQVCADSIGSRFFSGIGGQVDFNRGAARSPGGKAIIALPSTAQGNTVSRIVCQLTPGAGVVTTRGDVHYLVTEHGVAYLHGKSVQERAMALISIAHPDFRSALLKQAIEARLISAELADKGSRIIVGPKELRTTHLLPDGTQLRFRPVHPTDEGAMRQLFYTLSQQTVYYRFMTNVQHIPRKQIQDFTYIDHRNEVAICATLPEAYGEQFVSVGRYYLDPKSNLAEVAFVVQDEWQRNGIGTAVFQHLIKIARRNGIRGFTAEVLHANKPMQAVFNKSNCKLTTQVEDDVISYRMEFA